MISFRIISEQDIPVVQRLADEIWRKTFPGIISDEQIGFMLGKMYGSDTIRSEMKDGFTWKLIEDDGNPVGYYSFSMINPRQCKLHKIYIRHEFHGRRVGRTAIEDVAEYARSQKASDLILFVNRSNTGALNAYVAWGFKILGEVDTDFGNGFMLNDYKMGLKL